MTQRILALSVGIAMMLAPNSGCGKRTISKVSQSYSISDLTSAAIEYQERLAEGRPPRDISEIERCSQQFSKSVTGSAFEADAVAIADKVKALKSALATKSATKQAIGPTVDELVNTISTVGKKLE